MGLHECQILKTKPEFMSIPLSSFNNFRMEKISILVLLLFIENLNCVCDHFAVAFKPISDFFFCSHKKLSKKELWIPKNDIDSEISKNGSSMFDLI